MSQGDAIAYVVAQMEHAPAHTRPYMIEALVRNGADRSDVISALDPSREELEKADALLAAPSVYEGAR